MKGVEEVAFSATLTPRGACLIVHNWHASKVRPFQELSGAADVGKRDGSGSAEQFRPENAHQVCRLLLAGEGEKGQQAAAGALLKLLGSCPTVVLGLPQLMAAGSGEGGVGWLSLLRSKTCK